MPTPWGPQGGLGSGRGHSVMSQQGAWGVHLESIQGGRSLALMQGPPRFPPRPLLSTAWWLPSCPAGHPSHGLACSSSLRPDLQGGWDGRAQCRPCPCPEAPRAPQCFTEQSLAPGTKFDFLLLFSAFQVPLAPAKVSTGCPALSSALPRQSCCTAHLQQVYFHQRQRD